MLKIPQICVVLVLGLVSCTGKGGGAGTSSTVEPTTTVTDTQTVEALVDAWGAAWVANESDAVAAAFGEEGEYRGRFDGIYRIGREEIAAHVVEIANAGFTPTLFERTGSAVNEDGHFTVPVRYAYRGTTFEESLVVELDDGLFATVIWRP